MQKFEIGCTEMTSNILAGIHKNKEKQTYDSIVSSMLMAIAVSLANIADVMIDEHNAKIEKGE